MWLIRATNIQGSASNVKFQVVRLMRMLVQICQTLDYVPPEVSHTPLPCHPRRHHVYLLACVRVYPVSYNGLILVVSSPAVPLHEDELPPEHSRCTETDILYNLQLGSSMSSPSSAIETEFCGKFALGPNLQDLLCGFVGGRTTISRV